MYSHPLGSDKHYWHRYTEMFYEGILSPGKISNVLEFGTYRGDSVRWLAQVLPNARIWSVDIVEPTAEWPASNQIFYHRLDQDDRKAIGRFLREANVNFDLVIEDGSHIPFHQANSLFETADWMAKGGVYVIEDIHTSAEELRGAGQISPANLGFDRRSPKGKRDKKRFREAGGLFSGGTNRAPKAAPRANLFSLCLALERSQALGRDLNKQEVNQLVRDGFMSIKDIETIEARVGRVEIHRRNTLPLACHGCLSDENFNYATLRCDCGTRLFKDDDSMSAILYF